MDSSRPTPIHLQRGQHILFIWHASLDCQSKFRKDGPVQRGINPELLTAVTGEPQSFAGSSSNEMTLPSETVPARILRIS